MKEVTGTAGEPGFMLFSGTNDRAVIALVRVISECSVPLGIVARSRTDRILRSRYVSNVVHVRDSDRMDPGALVASVAAASSAGSGVNSHAIIPISEYFNRVALRVRNSGMLAPGCTLALVDESTYLALSDKEPCTQLFRSNGFRTPRQYEDFERAHLPCVAKPRRNLDPMMRSLYPVLIPDAAALDSFLKAFDKSHYFAQEYVSGASYYLLSYLSRDGRDYVSSQKNLAQQAGGKSIVLAETADFHRSKLADATISLLRDVGYTGFAMIEFIDDGGGPCFIELNPRPWGPLQLCADHRCGIIEAFIGDWTHDDSGYYQARAKAKPAAARYAWTGGMLTGMRAGAPLSWRMRPAAGRLRAIRALASDVYLRRDSWRVFFRELSLAGSPGAVRKVGNDA